MSDCQLCGRGFETYRSLQQHSQDKHPKCYCARCQQPFSSKPAKQQHVLNSKAHNICKICSHKPDFLSKEELEEHSEAKHSYCTPCERSFNTREQLVKHDLAEHNMCETCHKHFQSVSNLTNVSLHEPYPLEKSANITIASQNTQSKDCRMPGMRRKVRLPVRNGPTPRGWHLRLRC